MAEQDVFRIGYARSFLTDDGSIGLGDVGLGLLEGVPGIEHEFLAERTGELRPEQVAGFDALVLLGERVTRATLAGADRLAVIARFGVGYDAIDVPACTEHGVVLTITPDGVRRPMATTILTFLLALHHRLLEKDRQTRAGVGFASRLSTMGYGLTGKLVGSIGVGNIGKEFFRLAQPLEMRFQAHDPYVRQEDVADLGVQLVDLETLLTTSDVVLVNCPLNEETHHLLDAERLALLKPSAFVISTARGPIVDQMALTEVLREKRIRGAALDVFEQEPVDPNDPILTLDNVILSPHGLAWTDEWVWLSGRSCIESMLAVATGVAPRYVVNRAVLETEGFASKLQKYADQSAQVGRQLNAAG
jgi:phosphoglycerate dehydrogenase-like enzyme